MANLKDHLRRDAEAAVRATLALYIGQYSRRMIDRAYTEVSERIDALDPETRPDGIEIGREAARTAFNHFLPLTDGGPQPAIEGGDSLDSPSS